MTDVKLTFEEFSRGDVIEDQYAAQGVRIYSLVDGKENDAHSPAMIFDSARPTGGDWDLKTDNLGKVLIVSEDGDECDPDDEAHGGVIGFDFEEPVDMTSITLLDVEEGAKIKLYDADDALIGTKWVQTSNNGQCDVDLSEFDGVAKMEVQFHGSGALDNVSYSVPEPADDCTYDGTVEGTDGDDLIDAAYDGDPECDRIDNDDALPNGGDADLVVAGKGDDTVIAGAADDTIYGGMGNDTLKGNDGDDVIYGDKDLPGTEKTRESFEWDKLTDSDGKGDIDDGDRVTHVSQDTGSVCVTFDKVWASHGASHEFSDETQYVEGIDDGSEQIDADSGFRSDLSYADYGRAKYQFGFDKEVHNVDFRINDIDGSGKVTIKAYDTQNNEVAVTLTKGEGLEFEGSNTVKTGWVGTYDDTDSEKFSSLVTIEGPVSKIVVEHSEGYNNSSIWISDVYFDAVTETPAHDGAGNDYIDGGDGDDEMYGGAGDDRIIGGAGNDIAYGGDGNDEMDDVRGSQRDNADHDTYYGGAGDDEVYTGYGDDEAHGDEGNDTVSGEFGNDTVYGGDGDDVVKGGTGNDTMYGGDGNDRLVDGDDEDTVYGGKGEDTFVNGRGADELYGGLDNDLFLGGQTDDKVVGGEDPDLDGDGESDDWDVLDLTGSGVDYIDRDDATDGIGSGGEESGRVYFLDGTTMTFEEIEKVIPCFTPGTAIATPRGEVLVEDLKVGDRVITRDNGIQEIRWLGHKTMSGTDFVRDAHLKPVLITAGSLGHGLPERDMLVSPNHRVLVASDRTQLYFDETEVLASAKHLVGKPGIHRLDTLSTTYIHFMFDRHEVVLSNGAWTESFQPGDWSLKGIDTDQRAEIFALFPELREARGLEGYTAARKVLKKHEARLLAE
ncbi:Hint domain-containing protein [Histidinibacterium aquaticum]|uniref:Type I secretion protein n=1 Tax=Histidinibacterium aquaticum TaxID=2613962 RepID=A0A5J5GN75_9RHOB|nr:Hint domain-containing protein [Histidinibacterium aquaticum]KAA9009173.1 type I secretion protein [Histidinibacterium aquaticum]